MIFNDLMLDQPQILWQKLYLYGTELSLIIASEASFPANI